MAPPKTARKPDIKVTEVNQAVNWVADTSLEKLTKSLTDRFDLNRSLDDSLAPGCQGEQAVLSVVKGACECVYLCSTTCACAACTVCRFQLSVVTFCTHSFVYITTLVLGGNEGTLLKLWLPKR